MQGIKMESMPKISVIIPFSTANHYLDACLEHCCSLDYPDFEIILLPDEPLNQDPPDVQVIPTGHTDPSLKRNIGITHSTGEICALSSHSRHTYLRCLLS